MNTKSPPSSLSGDLFVGPPLYRDLEKWPICHPARILVISTISSQVATDHCADFKQPELDNVAPPNPRQDENTEKYYVIGKIVEFWMCAMGVLNLMLGAT